MSSKPHYFAIGIFVLAATALGLVGAVLVASDAMRSPQYFLETYVDESVQGIDVGTPFKFRGVKVGSVSEIEMVGTVYDTAKMYVMIRVALDDKAVMQDPGSLPERARKMVKDGLRFKLVPQGITGLSFLEADYFPDSNPVPLEIDWEPRYTYIPSTPAMMTVLGRSLERLASEIDTLNLQAMGANVEQITSNLNLAVQNMEQITRNAAVASDDVITNIKKASDDLPGVTSNLAHSISMIQEIVEDSDHELDRILLNLGYITDETRELMRMLKRYPGMLLTEPPKETLRK
jgi:phospholipid/cholesterol/gamma-HCH transport system substrate-binding protein